MSTFDDLVAEVRVNIGEDTASFWTDYEIEDWVVNGIRNAQDDVPVKALFGLLNINTFTGSPPTQTYGFFDINEGLSANLKALKEFLKLNVKNSYNTIYTKAWDFVDFDYLSSIEADEGGEGLDDTLTRLFAIYSTTTAGITKLVTYPHIPSGRTFRLQWIRRASESDTMTLPTTPNLQQLAVFEATSLALAKKGIDLEGSANYSNKRKEALEKIWSQYGDAK